MDSDIENMPYIVGVRFKPVTKVYYFDPGEFTDLTLDDWVIVETSRGLELGQVALGMREVDSHDLKSELKEILRKATPVDLLMAQEYRHKEAEALETCRRLAKELNIPMKVVQAMYSFDGSRLLLSFCAEQRVDFRDLVKELAKHLQTRIEMKQIGDRDETKIIDGYGRCGRRLCCSSWLTEFHPVSIRMAKQQGLPLAPAEISGACGRLLCCLAYEDTMYSEIRHSLPKVGSQLMVNQMMGIVRGLNIIQEKVIVQFPDESMAEISLDELAEHATVATTQPPRGRPNTRPVRKQEDDDDDDDDDDFEEKGKASKVSPHKAPQPKRPLSDWAGDDDDDELDEEKLDDSPSPQPKPTPSQNRPQIAQKNNQELDNNQPNKARPPRNKPATQPVPKEEKPGGTTDAKPQRKDKKRRRKPKPASPNVEV